MKAESALQLLLHANQLKRVPRTGWMMRGVVNAESVSDHTFGVAFVSLVLAELVEESVDIAKLLSIALLHDLPEAILSDIPAPALRHLAPGAKEAAEDEVLRMLLEQLPRPEKWHAWWREFEQQASVEARLVRDADRMDRLIQAFVYEETTGNLWLQEFWSETSPEAFEFEASRSLFEALCRASGRPGGRGDAG
ncbi:MAG: HD domain-containing protein [Chloroflexota bacterium]|nr:HD domain-containing protein [Chloroflexota bacterium]